LYYFQSLESNYVYSRIYTNYIYIYTHKFKQTKNIFLKIVFVFTHKMIIFNTGLFFKYVEYTNVPILHKLYAVFFFFFFQLKSIIIILLLLRFIELERTFFYISICLYVMHHIVRVKSSMHAILLANFEFFCSNTVKKKLYCYDTCKNV